MTCSEVLCVFLPVFVVAFAVMVAITPPGGPGECVLFTPRKIVGANVHYNMIDKQEQYFLEYSGQNSGTSKACVVTVEVTKDHYFGVLPKK